MKSTCKHEWRILTNKGGAWEQCLKCRSERKRRVGTEPEIYVIWHDWANWHEATFTDRAKAAAYARMVRRTAPQHLTRLTIIHY